MSSRKNEYEITILFLYLHFLIRYKDKTFTGEKFNETTYGINNRSMYCNE